MLISTLRTELDAVAAVWSQSATARLAALHPNSNPHPHPHPHPHPNPNPNQARLAALHATFNGLQPWQQSSVKPWYATQFLYLKEVAANKPPHLEISWTTRFNAWVPKDDPYNYVTNDPLPAWARNSSFATDNEGARFYANVSVLLPLPLPQSQTLTLTLTLSRTPTLTLTLTLILTLTTDPYPLPQAQAQP